MIHYLKRVGLLVVLVIMLAVVISVTLADAAADHGMAPPRATISTFAKNWWTHGGGLGIKRNGQGLEGASAGCCQRIFSMNFKLVEVTGTTRTATAIYRVTAMRLYAADQMGHTLPRVGQLGRLRLRDGGPNGVITDTTTGGVFCSPAISREKNVCGA